eukprot:TRINITY_DN1993_c0_g1_i4.p3 TRINITY_DN1993_c0_g1~~TRINITY_DN1993_c0_g1_i4.p3  ORF type:complete len:216 (-),score=53.73 TRINITY_DN1993_c0_g1_i4:14-661(-)
MDDYQSCNTFCSTYGYCINGKCLCIDGHEGETCGLICIDNCDKCSDASTCDTCNSNYYLNEDSTKCIKQCSADTWLDNKQEKCVKCVEFCVICKDATQCSKCIAGRSVSSDSLSCNCDQGTYSAENGDCLLCADAISNCNICSNNTICEQCFDQYDIDKNGKCQKEVALIDNSTDNSKENQTDTSQSNIPEETLNNPNLRESLFGLILLIIIILI